MTEPYIVQATGLVIFPQRNSPTHDGFADENADSNCWAACVCSFLRRWGVRRPDSSWYEPDDIKDWAFNQGTTGEIGFNTTIQNCLAHFGNIPSVTYTPQVARNGVNGLLDLEWQYLHRGIPLIESVDWIDDFGIVRPDVNHWTEIWKQTEALVTSYDSWPLPSGGERVESYVTHFQRSNRVVVVPTIAPPKEA